MHIYAIGDLHLSGEPPSKPMEIFGGHWQGYKEKLRTSWLTAVEPEDAVIICGDISWALTLPEALPDLEWIAELPGRKLLLRGNHDYWWASLAKMQALCGGKFEFLQNNCVLLGETAVCGTRGWLLPSAESFGAEDDKIYRREGIRLELSLQAARKAGARRLITALHYPPLFKAEETTLFTELLERYGVRDCVYGHIHGGAAHPPVYEGERRGVSYKLVSCDTQDFRLYRIL